MVCSDVGKINAALATYCLLCTGDLDFVVVAGLSGAIQPFLKLGDVIVAESASFYDIDIPRNGEIKCVYDTSLDLFKKTMNIYKRNTDFCSIVYEKNNKMINSNIYSGVILTGDKVVTSIIDIPPKLISTGLCVDMESAAIYQTCEYLNTRCISIRVISDVIGMTSPLQILRYKQTLCDLLGNVLELFIEKY